MTFNAFPAERRCFRANEAEAMHANTIDAHEKMARVRRSLNIANDFTPISVVEALVFFVPRSASNYPSYFLLALSLPTFPAKHAMTSRAPHAFNNVPGYLAMRH